MKKILCAILVLALTSFSMGMGVYENALPEVNVTSYGATGNGITDDTAFIQKAIDTGASKVIIPDGTYMINAKTALKARSNQKIQLSEKAVLKAIPNNSQYYIIFNLTDVKIVVISGGTLIGERFEHSGTTGQFGYGVAICNGTNGITISNMTIKEFWGDGIFIGSGPTPARNVLIDNVVCDNNRRQGMSITSADNVMVNNCVFKNTNGTAPEAGIDIEPYDNKVGYVNNVIIQNSSFIDNKWAGIAMFGEYGMYVSNVKVFNCVFKNNAKNLVLSLNITNSGYTNSIDSASYSWLTSTTAPSVHYQTSVQDIGWQGEVINGSASGTSGQSKRLEAIKIGIDNLDGGIEYRTHVQDIGWTDWVADGVSSGTTGQSKRLEAIQIKLTGSVAEKYDIYYRVHAQNAGWLDWAKNGESSGTAGFSYRLEAIQIILVTKGGTPPGSTVQAFEQAL